MKTFKLLILLLVGISGGMQGADRPQNLFKESNESPKHSYFWTKLFGTGAVATGIVFGGPYVASRYGGCPKAWNGIKGVGNGIAHKLGIDPKEFMAQSAETVSQAWRQSIKPELSNTWNTASAIATPILSHPATPAFLTAAFIVGSGYIGNKIFNNNIHHNSSPNRHTFSTCPHLLSCRTKLAGCTSLVGLGTAAGTAWTLKNLGHDLSSTPVVAGALTTGAVVGGCMYNWLNTKEAHARRSSYKGIGIFRELGVILRMPAGIYRKWNSNNIGN